MRVSRNINAPNVNLEYLTQTLIAWYRTEQYDVERSDSGKGSVNLKCRRANGKEAKPSILVTLHQQNSGLTVDIKVIKRGRLLLITALILSAMVGLFSLLGGACGFGIFLLAIGFCVFCSFNLSRNSNMLARTFTVVEQFVTPAFPGVPPGPMASIMPPMQQQGFIGGNRQPWSSPRQQPSNFGLPDGQGKRWNPPGLMSGRDAPVGPPVHGMADRGWDVGAGSSRSVQRSARDEPIGSPAPDTTSSNSISYADDLVPSTFSPKESTGTTGPATGAATRACSCGEMNPANVNFCERCGKPLTSPM